MHQMHINILPCKPSASITTSVTIRYWTRKPRNVEDGNDGSASHIESSSSEKVQLEEASVSSVAGTSEALKDKGALADSPNIVTALVATSDC